LDSFDNFDGRYAVVQHGPYEFGVPGVTKDYIMQESPEVGAGRVKLGRADSHRLT